MVKALELMYCSLFPPKQLWPVFSGRVLKFVNAPLPFAPHGSPLKLNPVQDAPPAKLTQVVFCSPPVTVRALPVAELTTVLVSHPPAAPFKKPFRPSSPGRLYTMLAENTCGRSKSDSPRLARGLYMSAIPSWLLG